MTIRQTLKLLGRSPPVLREPPRRLLGAGFLEIDVNSMALTRATGAREVGSASAFKDFYLFTFHSPPGCLLPHRGWCFPLFSVIGAPAALFTVI